MLAETGYYQQSTLSARKFYQDAAPVEALGLDGNPRVVGLQFDNHAAAVDVAAFDELAKQFGRRGIQLQLGKQCSRVEGGDSLTVHYGDGEAVGEHATHVIPGETGRLVPPRDPEALAGREAQAGHRRAGRQHLGDHQEARGLEGKIEEENGGRREGTGAPGATADPVKVRPALASLSQELSRP